MLELDISHCHSKCPLIDDFVVASTMKDLPDQGTRSLAPHRSEAPYCKVCYCNIFRNIFEDFYHSTKYLTITQITVDHILICKVIKPNNQKSQQNKTKTKQNKTKQNKTKQKLSQIDVSVESQLSVINNQNV